MTAETAVKSTGNGLAIFMSFVWPGLGQLYQRRFTSGAIFLGGSVAFAAVAWLYSRFSFAGWTAVAVLAMWSMYDVYRSPPHSENEAPSR